MKVASNYFFIIKLQFKGTDELENEITLTKLHLVVTEKIKDMRSNLYNKCEVHIERDLKQLKIVKGGLKEHEILFYTENLGATVKGHIVYKVAGK